MVLASSMMPAAMRVLSYTCSATICATRLAWSYTCLNVNNRVDISMVAKCYASDILEYD